MCVFFFLLYFFFTLLKFTNLWSILTRHCLIHLKWIEQMNRSKQTKKKINKNSCTYKRLIKQLFKNVLCRFESKIRDLNNWKMFFIRKEFDMLCMSLCYNMPKLSDTESASSRPFCLRGFNEFLVEILLFFKVCSAMGVYKCVCMFDDFLICEMCVCFLSFFFLLLFEKKNYAWFDPSNQANRVERLILSIHLIQ